MERLVIGNFKGGVGKTTLAVNLAVGLAGLGRRVLLIDTDPSAAVSAHLNVRPKLALYHLLMEEHSVEDIWIHLDKFGDLFVLPSSKATQAAEFQLTSQLGREHVLANRLQSLHGLDYVLIDTPPSISVVAQNALVYARRLLVPVSMDPMSLLGAASSFALCSDIREKLKIDCGVLGIVPTFVESRRQMTGLVMNALRATYSHVTLFPGVRSDAAVRKAVAAQKPILEYERASRAAQDFSALTAVLDDMLAGARLQARCN